MLSLLLTAALAGPTPAPLQIPPASPTAQDPPIPENTELHTTDSGLQYCVLSKGEGTESPSLGDRVRVHYTGWLEDGKVFDSSVQRGVPAEFGLGHVIEGWNEGLQLMHVGDRYKFIIPGKLGYGEQGTPDGAIPPGATLIFEVELLDIVAHSMPFEPWTDGEGVVDTGKGTQYRILDPGDGILAKDGKVMVLDFGFWTEEGQILQSTTLNGRPLLVDPAKIPLPFLEQISAQLRGGTDVLLRIDSKTSPNLGFDDYDHVIGHVHVLSVLDFAKPMFRMPADDELTTTDSGLRYKILSPGGPFRPGPRAQVAAQYAGWLTDGTPFDNSYDKGRPLQAGLTNLIKGWQEGMRLVGRGGKIILVVPPQLGYGDANRPGIPAGSTLVFVVELIDFRG